MLKALFFFFLGAAACAIATVALAITGVIKTAKDGDINVTFDLPKSDIQALSDEAEAPSGKPIPLTEKGATATCGQDAGEPCKVSFQLLGRSDLSF